jgi:hypothetical protein
VTQPAAARPRSTGWIVAGVVLLLLLGVAGVVTLMALDSGESSEPEVQPTIGSPTPNEDQFGPVPDLCDQTDLFAPVFDILPLSFVGDDSELDGEGLYQRGCIFKLGDDSSVGSFRVSADIYRSQDRARNAFRAASRAAEGFAETQEELDADWDEGVVLRNQSQETAQLVLRDGVLLVDLWWNISGDADDVESLLQVAEDIREAMRR